MYMVNEGHDQGVLEASEADAGESYAYSDYIEGSVQNLSELAGGEE